jgi:hypothetical protein
VSKDERTYTDDEFARIFEKAAELAGSPRSISRIENGLTMEEIKSIAAEAGLDPDLVGRAVRLVSHERRPSLVQRIIGGPFRVRRDFSLLGELTDERAQRLLTSARSAMQTRGEGDGDAAGVSWSTKEFSHVFVSAYGEGAETRVQVAVDNRPALLIPIILGTAGLVAVLYAAIAAGDNGFGNPYFILFGGWVITAAWVWSALRGIARKTRATFESVVEALATPL